MSKPLLICIWNCRCISIPCVYVQNRFYTLWPVLSHGKPSSVKRKGGLERCTHDMLINSHPCMADWSQRTNSPLCRRLIITCQFSTLHLNTAPSKRASRHSHTLTFQPTNSVEIKSLSFSGVTSLNSLIDGQISGTQNTGGGGNSGVRRF